MSERVWARVSVGESESARQCESESGWVSECG